MQLSYHSLDVASLIIPTSELPQRPFKRLAVTPMSPPMVLRQRTPRLENLRLNDSPGSSKEAEKKAARERKIAPPDAKMPSKTLPKEEKAEDEKKPGKDTYHIIRIYQSYGNRYLELLRQDSDGYIIAWRLLFSLDECFTAHWCVFVDFAYLMADLPFLKMRVMMYDSAYNSLKHLYYGLGTLDVIIDDFLDHLYANPEESTHGSGKTFFQILCLLFGEAPRLGAIRKFIELKIEAKFSHYDCANDPAHHLGYILNSVLPELIKDWADTCDTAFYLILALLEEAVRKTIGASGSSSVRELIKQFDFNKAKAHERCEDAMEIYSEVFFLTKDLDSAGKSHVYGALALNQLIHKQLHLLKHKKHLVVPIILSQGHFRKEIVLPGVKSDKQNLACKPIDSADRMFWKHFDSFVSMKKRSPLGVINFLEDARPFLFDYGFNEVHLETYTVIVDKCSAFIELRFTEGKSAVQAAKTAWESGVKWTKEDTSTVIDYLKDHRPAAFPPVATPARD